MCEIPDIGDKLMTNLNSASVAEPQVYGKHKLAPKPTSIAVAPMNHHVPTANGSITITVPPIMAAPPFGFRTDNGSGRPSDNGTRYRAPRATRRSAADDCSRPGA